MQESRGESEIYYYHPTANGFNFRIINGREAETRSGTEKQFSHNWQIVHYAWWTVNIFKIEARSEPAEEMIKKLKKKMILCIFVFCISYLFFGTEIAGETKTQS